MCSHEVVIPGQHSSRQPISHRWTRGPDALICHQMSGWCPVCFRISGLRPIERFPFLPFISLLHDNVVARGRGDASHFPNVSPRKKKYMMDLIWISRACSDEYLVPCDKRSWKVAPTRRRKIFVIKRQGQSSMQPSMSVIPVSLGWCTVYHDGTFQISPVHSSLISKR